MTGYGRNQQVIEQYEIVVEIRSVNHRYFEFSPKISRNYLYIEDKLKSLVASQVSRGKVEVGVFVTTVADEQQSVTIDRSLAKGYVEALRSVADELNLTDNIELTSLLRINGLFTVEKKADNQDDIWDKIEIVAKTALADFVGMKVVEGEKLHSDITQRVRGIESCVDKIEALSKNTVFAYKERLANRLEELIKNTGEVEQRVLTEVAMFADKIAIDEELVRLKIHISHLEDIMQKGDVVGRKLDFLVQEINREINTIGSKCQDVEISTIVIDVKSELEKIREQIQNIE